MNNGIKIPVGLQKILNITKGLDEESQAQVLRSASIFAYGRVSGRKSDYLEGYKAGYAQGLKEGQQPPEIDVPFKTMA